MTEITDPDWEPIMKIASAIVTDKGGRTSHAAIVSRELGIPCIVGSNNATKVLKNGKEVTYILFPDEGHGPAKFANKMIYLDYAERFLSEHLGGSYQPVSRAILANSSAQVVN